MKARFIPCLRHSLLISLVLLPAVHAQSVWTGSTSSVLSTGTNYSPAIANTTVSGLNIQFDGTDETTEDLTLATAMGGAAGSAGSVYTVLAAQTNPLTITGSGTAAMRISTGLTVEADAGAVSFLGSGGLNFGGSLVPSTHALSNESSNVLNLGTWNVSGGGGTTLPNGGPRSVNAGGAGDITSNGVWANYIILNKVGVGTLTLGGTNTYIGATTVSDGVLELTNALALQNSALDTSGAGSVTVVGPTTLATGGLTGSVDLASVITTGYSGITELTLNPLSGTQTYSGAIANGAAGMNLVKSGGGTQVLSGPNSYSGTTSVNGGTLRLGSTDALGSTTRVSVNGNSGGIGAAIGSLDLAGITLATAIPLDLNSGANNNDVGALQNSSSDTTNVVTWSGEVELKRSTIVGIGNITFTGGFSGGGFSLNKNGLRTLAITNGGDTSLNELKANRGTIQVNSGTTLDVATIVVGSGNSVGAGLTLNGGSVTCSGTSYFGTATSGTASGTLTLTAGTLTVAGLSKGPSAGPSVQFNANFNGGTLEASGDNPTFLTGANNARVQAGGAFIDVDNYLVEIPQALIHDTALDTPSVTADGGLTKSGLGTLTLSGANTYTGHTTISEGNFELAPSGSLKFVPTTSGTTNKVTGSGSASFKGSFNIDLTNAEVADGNSWVLADVPGQTFDETTFAVTGFDEGPEGTWTFEDVNANTWTFTEDNATLTVDIALPGYSSWIDDFTVSDPAPGADPENDGVENLMEYVLNGNPSQSDPAILPDLDASGANFVFTFTRREESANDTTQVFEYGSTLGGWTALSITAPTATEVSLGTPAGGLQAVTVTISKSLADPSGKLFGRLKVTQP